MSFFTNHIKKLDWVVIICSVCITLFGLMAIYSVSLAKDNFLNFEKQIIFFIIGFLLMLTISFLDYRILKNNSYLILILYFICLVLLAGLHFFAPDIRGTRGWYKVGLILYK